MRRYMFPIILFLTDTVTLCISVWLAVVLRFAGSGTNYQGYISNALLMIPLYIACHLICFNLFKLYRPVVDYFILIDNSVMPREVIAEGAQRLGWELDELLQQTLDAMKACEASVAAESL